jgi:hypothetical protein
MKHDDKAKYLKDNIGKSIKQADPAAKNDNDQNS